MGTLPGSRALLRTGRGVKRSAVASLRGTKTRARDGRCGRRRPSGVRARTRARLGVAPPATPPEGDTAAAKTRFRVFDAVAAFWQRAAARQPLLTVLDDLHRADVPSLRLLEFVAAELRATRLMILDTCRDAETRR